MLVLLIIFMVAAPLLTVGVPIDLPETPGGKAAADTQPITISVNRAGEIWIGDEAYPITEIVPKLQAIAKTGYDERILIRGDKTADYGTVMNVMAEISTAGYKNIGLVGLPKVGS
jgi:biopolymer transport protein TolR